MKRNAKYCVSRKNPGGKFQRLGIAIVALSLAGCAGNAFVQQAQKIAVQYEKLYIAPLQGIETLQNIENWPDDPARRAALMPPLQALHEQLVAEFRRCEKYGTYTVIDTPDVPTVYIAPRLEFKRIANDSLHMFLTLRVHNKATEKKYLLQIEAFGLFEPDSKASPAFHRLGLVLGSYRRNFPYKKAVSFFYPDDDAETPVP